MRVTVKDNEAIARNWGSGPGGVIVVTGDIADTCQRPACGQPRGEVRGFNGYEDGEPYHVNVWDNTCGHVDMYEDVVREIRARRAAAGGEAA
jgi:hypothetical protein